MGVWVPRAEIFAQGSLVEGRVEDRRSYLSVSSAHVMLVASDGTSTGTVTDRGGRYRLRVSLPGQYLLMVSHVAYEAVTDTLVLAFNDHRTVNVGLWPAVRQGEEVSVEAGRESSGTVVSAGLTTLSPREIGLATSPGLSPDLSAYLVTLPGVFAAADRGGQLYIRGGTPAENLVQIDGMTLYQPFHVLGFYSAFPADIIAYADVYAGGFGARYGGRLSSVIDVNTRSGDKYRTRGAITLSPFLTSGRLEIPVHEGMVSLLLNGRESMVDRIPRGFWAPDMPFRFGDYFGKLHAFLNQTSSVTITGLTTHDAGTIPLGDGSVRESRWRNAAAGGRYTYLSADAPVIAQIAAYYSLLDSEQSDARFVARTSKVESGNGEITFSWLMGDLRTDLGIFGRTYFFTNDLGDRVLAEEETVSEGGAYLDGRYQVGRALLLEPGIRYHSYTNGSGGLEPRFRATLRLPGFGGSNVVSAAAGLYRQEVMGLSGLSNLTESFIAWAPVPASLSAPSAVHAIGSWRARVAPGIDVSVEGYRKWLQNQVFATYSGIQDAVVQTLGVSGSADGLDVRLNMTRERFNIFLGYGYSRVRYMPETGSSGAFYPPHDRRHQATALVSYSVSGFRAHIQWQYGSGTPFTRYDGFYNPIAPGSTGEDMHTDPGAPVYVLGPRYTGRLSDYHRLDASIERSFAYGGLLLTGQASVFNVYNRPNLYDLDIFTGRRSNQLPFLPSVAFRVEF